MHLNEIMIKWRKIKWTNKITLDQYKKKIKIKQNKMILNDIKWNNTQQPHQGTLELLFNMESNPLNIDPYIYIHTNNLINN